MKKRKADGPKRPMPPSRLFENMLEGALYIPAPEVRAWIEATFLDDRSPLFNIEHIHIRQAHYAILWTNELNVKQGRRVAGTAENVIFRCSAWQRGRQEQQMREWFGAVPELLITLDANYAAQASDSEFCALVEHELYHCGQACDEFGAPAFTKDGLPKFTLRGHDVEEFVGVVRRYGPTEDVQRVIDAAKGAPEVAKINIARACGTCLLKVA